MDPLFSATLERTALLQRAQRVIAGLATDSAALLWELDAQRATSFAPEAVAALSAAALGQLGPSTQPMPAAASAEEALAHSCDERQRLLARAYDAISALQVDVDALLWEIDQSLESPPAASPVPFPPLSSPAPGGHEPAAASAAASAAAGAEGKSRSEAGSPVLTGDSAAGPFARLLAGSSQGQAYATPGGSGPVEQHASGSLRGSGSPASAGGRELSPSTAGPQAEQTLASTPAPPAASWLFAEQQEQRQEQRQEQQARDAEAAASGQRTPGGPSLPPSQLLSPKTQAFVQQAYAAREAQMVQLASRPAPVRGTSLKEATAQTARMRSLRETLVSQAAVVSTSGASLLAAFDGAAALPLSMQEQQQQQQPARLPPLPQQLQRNASSASAGFGPAGGRPVPVGSERPAPSDSAQQGQQRTPLPSAPPQQGQLGALERLLSTLRAQPSAPVAELSAAASAAYQGPGLLPRHVHSWTSSAAPPPLPKQQPPQQQRMEAAAGSSDERACGSGAVDVQASLAADPSSFLHRVMRAARTSTLAEPGDAAAAQQEVAAASPAAVQQFQPPAAAAPGTSMQSNPLFRSASQFSSGCSPAPAQQGWATSSSPTAEPSSSMQASALLPPGLPASYALHSRNPLYAASEVGSGSSAAASGASSAAASPAPRSLGPQQEAGAVAGSEREPSTGPAAEQRSAARDGSRALPSSGEQVAFAAEPSWEATAAEARGTLPLRGPPVAQQEGGGGGSLPPLAYEPPGGASTGHLTLIEQQQQQQASRPASASSSAASRGGLPGMDSLLDELEAGMAALTGGPLPEGSGLAAPSAVPGGERAGGEELGSGLQPALRAAAAAAAAATGEGQRHWQPEPAAASSTSAGAGAAVGQATPARQPPQSPQLTAAHSSSPEATAVDRAAGQEPNAAGQDLAAGGGSEGSIADSFAHSISSSASPASSAAPSSRASPSPAADDAAAHAAALLRLHRQSPVHHRKHDSVGSLPAQSAATSPPGQSAAVSPPGARSLRTSGSGGPTAARPQGAAAVGEPAAAAAGSSTCGLSPQRQRLEVQQAPASLPCQQAAAGGAAADAAFEAASCKEAEAARLEREGLFVEAASAALEADRLHAAAVASRLASQGLKPPHQPQLPRQQPAAVVARVEQGEEGQARALLQQVQAQTPAKLAGVLAGGEDCAAGWSAVEPSSCRRQAAGAGRSVPPEASAAAAAEQRQSGGSRPAASAASPALAKLLSSQRSSRSSASSSLLRSGSLASEAAAASPAQRAQCAQAAVAVIKGKQAAAAERAAAAEAEAAQLAAEGRAEEAAAAREAAAKWRRRADKAARVARQAAKVVKRLGAEASAAALVAGGPAAGLSATAASGGGSSATGVCSEAGLGQRAAALECAPSGGMQRQRRQQGEAALPSASAPPSDLHAQPARGGSPAAQSAALLLARGACPGAAALVPPTVLPPAAASSVPTAPSEPGSAAPVAPGPPAAASSGAVAGRADASSLVQGCPSLPAAGAAGASAASEEALTALRGGSAARAGQPWAGGLPATPPEQAAAAAAAAAAEVAEPAVPAEPAEAAVGAEGGLHAASRAATSGHAPRPRSASSLGEAAAATVAAGAGAAGAAAAPSPGNAAGRRQLRLLPAFVAGAAAAAAPEPGALLESPASGATADPGAGAAAWLAASEDGEASSRCGSAPVGAAPQARAAPRPLPAFCSGVGPAEPEPAWSGVSLGSMAAAFPEAAAPVPPAAAAGASPAGSRASLAGIRAAAAAATATGPRPSSQVPVPEVFLAECSTGAPPGTAAAAAAAASGRPPSQAPAGLADPLLPERSLHTPRAQPGLLAAARLAGSSDLPAAVCVREGCPSVQQAKPDLPRAVAAGGSMFLPAVLPAAAAASPLRESSLNALRAQLDRLDQQLERSRQQRARAEHLCSPGQRPAAGAAGRRTAAAAAASSEVGAARAAAGGASSGSPSVQRVPRAAAATTWLSGFACGDSSSEDSEDDPAWLRGFAGGTP